MTSTRRFALLLGILLTAASVTIASTAIAADTGTRLLRTPTVSATEIAFAYAQNIWVVPRAGGAARRLTSFQGLTTNPHFSPDGKWIAFSGEYAGNLDVYVVPAAGRRADAPHVAPGRRPRAGLDARRHGRHVLVDARHVGAERRAALLDRAARGRRRVADAAAARLPGQDLARRHARRLPHEQLVGRGAPQLPRRPEPADLGSST